MMGRVRLLALVLPLVACAPAPQEARTPTRSAVPPNPSAGSSARPAAGAPPPGAPPAGAPPDILDPNQECTQVLRLPPDKHFAKQHDARPGVENDSVSLAVGETLCLDATEAGDTLADFRMVGPDFPKARIMRLHLEANREVGYVMFITNPYSRTLRYRATMFIPTSGGMKQQDTDVLPVLPGRFSAEQWPATFPLAGIVLHHFELVR